MVTGGAGGHDTPQVAPTAVLGLWRPKNSVLFVNGLIEAK